MRSSLFLSGFMGAGKSAVGRILAARAGLPFLDLDACIEESFGMTVWEIFRRHGEPAFRAAEASHLARCAAAPAVVALGGGAVLNPESRRLARAAGRLVYLRARPETLARRLEGGREQRPLLQGEGPLEGRVGELLAARSAAYEDADLVVDTDDLSPEAVAEEVLRRAEGST